MQSNDNNAPFSIHNYNEHVTPSAFVPYPKHNQLASEQQAKPEAAASDSKPQDQEQEKQVDNNTSQSKGSSSSSPPKPRVFTTVLHPTARSLQAELTLLATTP